MMPFFFKRLIRRPWLLAGTLAVSLLLTGAMTQLALYKDRQNGELERAMDAFRVKAVVTNLQGNSSEGLRGDEYTLDFVRSGDLTPYIRDIAVTKELEYYSRPLGLYLGDTRGYRLLGVTGPECDGDLEQCRIRWSSGWDAEKFYASSEYACVVSPQIYEQISKLGQDRIQLTVIDPIVSKRILTPDYGQGNITFQVAGVTDRAGTDLYMPFDAALRLGWDISCRMSWDSMSFYVRDNRELDKTESVAARLFRPVNSATKRQGLAVIFHDAQFRSTVSALEQNISRVRWILPLLAALSLASGLIVGFLATRNGEREYALSRTLGLGRAKLFLSVMASQLLPAAPALALGALGAWGQVLLYLASFAAGCAVCSVRLISTPPTVILREQE